MGWLNVHPGASLNRAVAERLGWTVEKIVAGGRNFNYRLCAPDGGKVGIYNEERLAWQKVPDYAGDMLTALTLVMDAAIELTLTKSTEGAWQAAIRDGETTHASKGKVGSPALAIVHAWLAWQDTDG